MEDDKEARRNAEKFFNELMRNEELQASIKQGIEKLAKDAGYVTTEEALTDELRKRWQCTMSGGPHGYSEPPGF